MHAHAHVGAVIMAHNASGYDSQFLLRSALEKFCPPKPNIIMKGRKILSIDFDGAHE